MPDDSAPPRPQPEPGPSDADDHPDPTSRLLTAARTEMSPEEAAELIAAAGVGAGGPAQTEQRYAREGADRLGPSLLDALARRATGAQEAAFFDLDKTVIARSSTLAMGRTFYRGGLLGPAAVLKSLYAQVVYQLVGADTDRMEQMRHALLDLVRGWEARRVERLVGETLEEVMAPLAYREALELLAAHRRLGRDVWIVSSSGQEIVEPLAHYLGVPEVLATRSGIDDDGRYDGTLEFFAYGPHKATAIRQVAEARGYDLERCYAYSDSVTDLPMLAAVGHPVAVNPDRELRAAARAMDWEVRDFVSPVSLRRRLPGGEPSATDIVLAAGAAAAVALIVWRYVMRDGS